MPKPIWFWQRIVSPHMAGLVVALAAAGRDVTYVAEQNMSDERASMGWHAPDLGAARLILASNADAVKAIVARAPDDSIHVCQGLRGNGLVKTAAASITRRGLSKWIVMETVEDAGWQGMLRRYAYRRLINAQQNEIKGVLAIGQRTTDWLADRGFPRERIFPFTYFLPVVDDLKVPARVDDKIRVMFVGRLIELKRIETLIDAVAAVGSRQVELHIVGAGPLEQTLRQKASGLAVKIQWHGQRDMGEIAGLMASADCVVLPSHHDGWGAVITEALMVGTVAICSDRCGAADAVRASGCGGVFAARDVQSLANLLRKVVAAGPTPPARRAALAAWAKNFGAPTGARYLGEILEHPPQGKPLRPPWWREGPVLT